MKRAALLLAAVALAGCQPAPSRVLTSANSWAWANARYEERCVAVVGQGCAITHSNLASWRKRLDEASAALDRGGEFPRQLKEIRDAEKKAVASLPKENP